MGTSEIVYIADRKFNALVDDLAEHMEDAEDGYAIVQHILMYRSIFSDLDKQGKEEYERIERLVGVHKR